MTVAVAIRARDGNAHCGDAARHWWIGSKLVLCVVDGLGHGREAQAAAGAALDYVGAHAGQPLQSLFSGCDRALYETRGAAMGVARIDTETDVLEYASVGNTRVLIAGLTQRRFLVSSPGIIGGGYRHLCTDTVRLTRGERVFLYTDGFPRSIDTAEFTRRLRIDDPRSLGDALLAALAKRSDDSAILIYHHGSAR